MKELPLMTEDLIKELDLAFPDKCPALDLSDREVWYRAGQRSVVNSLLQRKKKQLKKISPVVVEGDSQAVTISLEGED